jgi:hypothetical protein
VVGHDEAEHGVAEELEALVRRVPWVLGTPRTVHECGGEDLRREVDAEAGDQGLEVVDREGDQDS